MWIRNVMPGPDAALFGDSTTVVSRLWRASVCTRSKIQNSSFQPIRSSISSDTTMEVDSMWIRNVMPGPDAALFGDSTTVASEVCVRRCSKTRISYSIIETHSGKRHQYGRGEHVDPQRDARARCRALWGPPPPW
jgi:hypothetical protein